MANICPRCKRSKETCEYYDNGICRGVVYATYPPQYDMCVYKTPSNVAPCDTAPRDFPLPERLDQVKNCDTELNGKPSSNSMKATTDTDTYMVMLTPEELRYISSVLVLADVGLGIEDRETREEIRRISVLRARKMLNDILWDSDGKPNYDERKAWELILEDFGHRKDGDNKVREDMISRLMNGETGMKRPAKRKF